MERKAHITDERTGIDYTLCGDYYLPDLVLLTTLRTSGQLSEYLHSIDAACEETFSRLIKQYAEREGVTEPMKAADMMK